MTTDFLPPRIRPISQFNDPTTTQDGLNCTSAALCDLGLLATGTRMWPGDFRRLQGDDKGGIGLHDGAIAWEKAFPGASLLWAAGQERLRVPAGYQGRFITADRAWDLLALGYGLVVQGDYEVFDDADLAIQPGFRDDHAIYIEGTRTIPRTGRQTYRIDPLGRGSYDGEWVNWSLVVAYAARLAGTGRMYAAWARPAPPDTSTEVEEPVTTISPAPAGAVGHVSSAGAVDIWYPDGRKQTVTLATVKAFVQTYAIEQSDDKAPKGGPFYRLAERPYAGWYVAAALRNLTFTPPPVVEPDCTNKAAAAVERFATGLKADIDKRLAAGGT